jgi:hypothetical protein
MEDETMDDNVIKLHPKDVEFLQAAIDVPPQPNPALHDLLTRPSAIPDAPSPEFAQLDLDALFNLREWVRSALETAGAKIVGAGIGCGRSS